MALRDNKERLAAHGFTLIEMILVIALLGIIGTVTGFMLNESFRSYQLISNRKISLTDARLASDRMKSEILLIVLPTDITTASASALTFTLSGNPISYSLSGSDLLRNSDILATNVTSLAFRYFDASGNITAVIADIRRIEISLVVQAGANQGVNRIRTIVYPRNFYYANFQ